MLVPRKRDRPSFHLLPPLLARRGGAIRVPSVDLLRHNPDLRVSRVEISLAAIRLHRDMATNWRTAIAPVKT